MNAIGPQMRDLINSGLTRWRLMVWWVNNVAERGGIPRVSTRFSLTVENERGWRGTGPLNVSRETNSHARARGRQCNIPFSCSADHEQDWEPYPVDPYSATCDGHIYINT